MNNNSNPHSYDITGTNISNYLNNLLIVAKNSCNALDALVVLFDGSTYYGWNYKNDQISSNQKDLSALFQSTAVGDLLFFNQRYFYAVPVMGSMCTPIAALGVFWPENKEPHELEKNTLNALAVLLQSYLHQRAETKKIFKAEAEMMHRIVHDFKNPSTSISLAAEVITKKNDDPKIVISFAEKIKNASARLISQINRIYDFANIDDISFRPVFTDFQINDLFKKLSESLANDTEVNNQQIVIASKDFTINADYERLSETLYELLLNALNASDADKTVTLNAYNDVDHYFIEVIDQGSGIDESDMDQIFKKFASSKKHHGIRDSRGFGLARIKTLVHLQKAEINVSSEVGKGSIFQLKLPKN